MKEKIEVTEKEQTTTNTKIIITWTEHKLLWITKNQSIIKI